MKRRMPIHVDHEDIERHIVLAKAANQVVELAIAIGPVTRPPRSKRKSRRQGNSASDFGEIAERLLVVVPVSKEVQVLPLTGWTLHHPRPGTFLAMRKA